jgi:pre-mRNA-processing factor 19
MSVTFCALSGNPLEEPVVCTKTGHVFEKRVIEMQIDKTGQCPITGIDLEKKDLLPLKGKLESLGISL